MMRFSWLQITSASFLFLGNMLVISSLFTNYWSYYHVQIDATGGVIMNTNTTGHRGLYEICHGAHAELIQGYKACINRFRQAEVDPSNPASQIVSRIHGEYAYWEMACLVLMSIAVGLGTLSLFVSPVCCGTKFAILHGLFVLVTALCALLCVIVYMAYAVKSSMSTGTTRKFDAFGYSFVLGSVGSVSQLVSAIVFMVASRQRNTAGYERGSVNK